MTTSSSTAAEKNIKINLFIKIFLPMMIVIICTIIFFLTHPVISEYARETLNLDGSIQNGNNLFKMNCVGCHGITARGLVGPDLHSVTERLSDNQIITQVTKGLTPPMPSFEIDTQNMADLLIYLHTLN